MAAAKISGLIVEKKEVRSGSVLDGLPYEAIATLRNVLMAERDRRLATGNQEDQLPPFSTLPGHGTA